MRRRDGGDRLSNLMALCRRCHGWITEHPERARTDGFIVLANTTPRLDPEKVRVRIGRYGLWFFLLDDGTAVPLL
jgi:hypothetical protein